MPWLARLFGLACMLFLCVLGMPPAHAQARISVGSDAVTHRVTSSTTHTVALIHPEVIFGPSVCFAYQVTRVGPSGVAEVEPVSTRRHPRGPGWWDGVRGCVVVAGSEGCEPSPVRLMKVPHAGPFSVTGRVRSLLPLPGAGVGGVLGPDSPETSFRVSNREECTLRPAHQRPKLYWCLNFWKELDELELNLRELWDVLEKVIVVESPVTYSGRPKPLVFLENYERFAPYADKIVHSVFATVDRVRGDPQRDWRREAQQRLQCQQELQKLNVAPQDMILVTDTDEFISVPALNHIMRCSNVPTPTFLATDMHYFTSNWLEAEGNTWRLPALHTVGMLSKLSVDRVRPCQYCGKDCSIPDLPFLMNLYGDAGHHMTYFTGVEGIQQKLRSFAHASELAHLASNESLICRAIFTGRPLHNDVVLNYHQHPFLPQGVREAFIGAVLHGEGAVPESLLPYSMWGHVQLAMNRGPAAAWGVAPPLMVMNPAAPPSPSMVAAVCDGTSIRPSLMDLNVRAASSAGATVLMAALESEDDLVDRLSSRTRWVRRTQGSSALPRRTKRQGGGILAVFAAVAAAVDCGTATVLLRAAVAGLCAGDGVRTADDDSSRTARNPPCAIPGDWGIRLVLAGGGSASSLDGLAASGAAASCTRAGASLAEASHVVFSAPPWLAEWDAHASAAVPGRIVDVAVVDASVAAAYGSASEAAAGCAARTAAVVQEVQAWWGKLAPGATLTVLLPTRKEPGGTVSPVQCATDITEAVHATCYSHGRHCDFVPLRASHATPVALRLRRVLSASSAPTQ